MLRFCQFDHFGVVVEGVGGQVIIDHVPGHSVDIGREGAIDPEVILFSPVNVLLLHFLPALQPLLRIFEQGIDA